MFNVWSVKCGEWPVKVWCVLFPSPTLCGPSMCINYLEYASMLWMLDLGVMTICTHIPHIQLGFVIDFFQE